MIQNWAGSLMLSFWPLWGVLYGAKPGALRTRLGRNPWSQPQREEPEDLIPLLNIY